MIQSGSAARARLLIGLFTLTIFLSAALLFFVQPMFAKMVLPVLGGSSAVWTTAMLFFQTVLIGGYLYAHLITRMLSPRTQIAVHMVLCAAAFAFLPIAADSGRTLDVTGTITGQTLVIFAIGVGVPFMALAANAPLLQHWYRGAGGPAADDPYFLYGASNLGSTLALLAFPLLAEPLFGARAIAIGWAAGFVLLTALLALSGWQARGAAPEPAVITQSGPQTTPRPVTVLWWLLLAFIPSAMMLAVTALISAEIGAFPLIWVIPLTLYLATFVIAFRQRLPLPRRLLEGLFLLGFIAMVMLIAADAVDHLRWLSFAVMLAGFFLTALLAHRRLYEARPPARWLTGFYLTMSVGGAMGGVFLSLIAPAVFSDIHEVPIIVALSGLLLIRRGANWRTAGLGVGLALIAAAPVLLTPGGLRGSVPLSVLTASGVLIFLALYALRHRPAGLAPAAATLLALGAVVFEAPAVHADRSFFGAHKVVDSGEFRRYRNGTTIHGMQRIDALGTRPIPLAYYHPNGPLGQIMRSEIALRAETVGIVGLGVGALACYARPGQDWHFYEIDAVVDEIARDPALFSYMSECGRDAPTHLGDARLVLERQDLGFDILVSDAYSSDALPMHLMTVEAFDIYRERLAPGGILVMHISNRFYRLEKPLARIADALDLQALIRIHGPTVDRPMEPGETPTTAMIFAEPGTDLSEFEADPRWRRVRGDGGAAWTDDHAGILSLLLD